MSLNSSTSGSFAPGVTAYVTTYHPREASWSARNLPDELFQLEPFDDWGEEDLPIFLDSTLDKDGNRLPNSQLREYRDFDVPSQISIKPESWRLEYYTDRLDRRFGTKDLHIRMNAGILDKKPKTNAINMSKTRLRNALNIPNWTRLQKVATCIECLIAEQISWSSVQHNTSLPVRPEGLIKPSLSGEHTGGPAPAPLPLNRFLRNDQLHRPSQHYRAKLRLIQDLRQAARENGYPHWLLLPNKFKPREWQEKAEGQRHTRIEDNAIKFPEVCSIPVKAFAWIKHCIRNAVAAGRPMPSVNALPHHARGWVHECVTEGLARRRESVTPRPRDDSDEDMSLLDNGNVIASPVNTRTEHRQIQREESGDNQMTDYNKSENPSRKRQRLEHTAQTEETNARYRSHDPTLLTTHRHLEGRHANIANGYSQNRSIIGSSSNSPYLVLDGSPRECNNMSSGQMLQADNQRQFLRVRRQEDNFTYYKETKHDDLEANPQANIQERSQRAFARAFENSVDIATMNFLKENQRLDKEIAALDVMECDRLLDNEVVRKAVDEVLESSGLLNSEPSPQNALRSEYDSEQNEEVGNANSRVLSNAETRVMRDAVLALIHRKPSSSGTKRSREYFEGHLINHEVGQNNHQRRQFAATRRVQATPRQRSQNIDRPVSMTTQVATTAPTPETFKIQEGHWTQYLTDDQKVGSGSLDTWPHGNDVEVEIESPGGLLPLSTSPQSWLHIKDDTGAGTRVPLVMPTPTLAQNGPPDSRTSAIAAAPPPPASFDIWDASLYTEDDAEGDVDADGDEDADGEADRDVNVERNAEGNANADVDSFHDAVVDGEADGDVDLHVNANANTNAHADVDANINVNANANTNLHANINAVTDASVDLDADAEGEADPLAEYIDYDGNAT